MTNTWVLVAHRGGARVFENKGPGKGLNLVDEFENPAGKLKNREIDSDKQGRSFDSRGAGRHAYQPEQLPTEHVAEQFAKHLSIVLDDARNHKRYSRLVLVAEPRFLGNLRAALNTQTASLVSATVDKDLATTEARDLPRYLETVLAV